MYHLLAYEELTAMGASNEQLDAVPDSIFSIRNNNFIFSEEYQVLAAYAAGANITGARFNAPTLNVLGNMQIWPVERSITVADDPIISDYRDYPIRLPVREEISIEGSNNDGVDTDQLNVFLWIAAMNWTRNLPRGQQRIVVRATGATAGVANAWSGLGALTFATNLRGGFYSMIGAECFDAGVQAVRFHFPRANPVNGKQLRPGILATEAIGNNPLRLNMGGFGVMGVFDTDEPPTFEIYANATGASTQEFRLDLVYHGGSVPAGVY